MDNWKKRFKDKFVDFIEDSAYMDGANYKEVESFIEKAITEAKIEVLEKGIKENYDSKESLHDDLMDLLEQLKTKTK